MTEADWKALRLLVRLGSCTVGFFGGQLWPEKRRQPQSYARPAGKVLRRLEREGLAFVAYDQDATRWRASPAGVQADRGRG